MGAVDVRRRDVQAAVLEVVELLGSELLPARPCGHVVGGAGALLGGFRQAPEERRLGHHAHQRVDPGAAELSNGTADGVRSAYRGGGLQQHHRLQLRSLALDDVHGVQDGRFGGGCVRGEIGGAVDHARAVFAGHGCDLGVLGGDGDDHLAVATGFEGLGDGPGDQRFPADGQEVLAGDALGAPAGGDHGQHAHAAPSSTWAITREGSSAGTCGAGVGSPPKRRIP